MVSRFISNIKQSRAHFWKVSLLIVASIVLLLDLIYVFKDGFIYSNLDKNITELSQNILVEAHGLLFDLILFGIIIELVDSLRNDDIEISSYKREIDDFRGWDEKEATYRILGNIKRLHSKGVYDLNLTNCYLKGSDLRNMNFEKAVLSGACLEDCDLRDVNFKLAKLYGAKFDGSNIEGANFSHSFLYEGQKSDMELMTDILKHDNSGNIEEYKFKHRSSFPHVPSFLNIKGNAKFDSGMKAYLENKGAYTEYVLTSDNLFEPLYKNILGLSNTYKETLASWVFNKLDKNKSTFKRHNEHLLNSCQISLDDDIPKDLADYFKLHSKYSEKLAEIKVLKKRTKKTLISHVIEEWNNGLYGAKLQKVVLSTGKYSEADYHYISKVIRSHTKVDINLSKEAQLFT